MRGQQKAAEEKKGARGGGHKQKKRQNGRDRTRVSDFFSLFFLLFMCGVDGQLFGGSNKQGKRMRTKRRATQMCWVEVAATVSVYGRRTAGHGAASAGHVMSGRSDAATPLTA